MIFCCYGRKSVYSDRVAPLVGAWIEIEQSVSHGGCHLASLPSWERELK